MSIVCPKIFAIFQNRGEGRALSPYFSSANDVFSLRPDGDDVVPVHHVDRALEALAHRERMRGFGKVGVVDDNGVEIVAGDKAAVPAEILVSCAGAEVVALLTVKNSSFPSVCMWRNFDARMDMVMTLFIASSAPPAISDPSVTRLPSRSSVRTGATPEQMLMFDPAQCAVTTPCSRMASRSRSSEWTQCAMTV